VRRVRREKLEDTFSQDQAAASAGAAAPAQTESEAAPVG
jgi:hypothetical protein